MSLSQISSSLTTWKNQRNSRTYLKVPITIIIIIRAIVIIFVEYSHVLHSFFFCTIISRRTYHLLFLVARRVSFSHPYSLMTFLRHLTPRFFLSLFINIIIFILICFFNGEIGGLTLRAGHPHLCKTKIPLVCAPVPSSVMILTHTLHSWCNRFTRHTSNTGACRWVCVHFFFYEGQWLSSSYKRPLCIACR